MHVASAVITIRLPENQDLKGKRRVVKSLCARVRNKLNVSIAEVADNDLWQIATLGIACAGNSRRLTNEIIDAALRCIEGSPGDFEVIEVERE